MPFFPAKTAISHAFDKKTGKLCHRRAAFIRNSVPNPIPANFIRPILASALASTPHLRHNPSVKATETEIWSRTIRPEIGDLSPVAAGEFLRWHLSDVDAERVRHLSGKANAGTLEPEEETELDFYLNVARALEFLKSKARLSLHDPTTAN